MTLNRAIHDRLLMVGTTAVLALSLLASPMAAVAVELELTDVERQTREFMAYNESIELTDEQEAVHREALSKIPAPCCSDRSAYTCCCQCNAARTWWGLSKHLIADLGYDADEVRAKVVEWFELTNPSGYSGRACYTGGCARPFRQDGCGGMTPSRLAF